jgi:hypothetical protein
VPLTLGQSNKAERPEGSMTEAEWLSWRCMEGMIPTARQLGRAGDRQLRLFACACCRTIWERIWYRQSREAIETAERYADGLCDHQALLRAGKLASNVVRRSQYREEERIARDATLADAHQTAVWVLSGLGRLLADDLAAPAAQAHLFRDIVGNPFAPSLLSIRSGWCGMMGPSHAWLGVSTKTGNCRAVRWTRLAWPCLPTHWKKPAAPTLTSSTTCAVLVPTFAAAG